MEVDAATSNVVHKLAQVPECYDAFEAELAQIAVPQDPTPTQISTALVQLDTLFQKVYPYAVRARVAYDNVSSMLDEVMMSAGKGTNPTAMKADAAQQAQHYRFNDGDVISLFELQRLAKSRHVFYDGLMQAIAQKHSRLITLIGARNLETKLIT